MRKSFVAAAAALAVVSTAAVASVTFDSSTGTGFVGKGDVQLAFGWNNAAAQKNATAVSFGYDAVDKYDVECYWETTTGNGRVVVHDITVPRHTSVSSAVTYEARKTGQYTGYNLNGFGATTTNGTVPVVGGTCPGQSNVATIIDVTQTGSTGGLSVTYNGVTVALPNTPVL
jgi:hypothetical protein